MAEKDNAVEKVKELVLRLRQQYAGDPNITSIGWGLARRGGRLEDGVAIIFTVREKLPSDRSIESAGSQPIPTEIEGIPTDVQAVKLRPLQGAGDRDEIKFDPLRGGIASSNSEHNIAWFNGMGTLGILARDNATNAPVALSNWHVWGDGGSTGDQIIQPGHPTGGDHVEAVGKVLACGPLLTALIEWEVPSPLTLGLYGGAAVAAVAAAASDYRDPTRRGQDNTATNPGELTEREMVDMAIEYPQLPLPGLPFKTSVKWRYQRETTDRVLTHEVEEDTVNTQFLLGKLITTDKSSYQPGDTVQLTAAIWDYQPRSCESYHVVAHLIAHNRPEVALRVALHPTACPRKFPHDPPDGDGDQSVCIDFKDHKVAEYPYKGAFEWLGYLSVGQLPVRIVDWIASGHAMQIPSERLLLFHMPANKVVAKVAQFTNTPVTMTAYNAAGEQLDQQTAPEQQGEVHELVLRGEGIVRVLVHGGGGEGLLLSYCIDPVGEQAFRTAVSEGVASSVRNEVPQLKLRGKRLKANRCCFAGSIPLPPDEQPGKWDIHLTVQNINPVPEGTPPEEAATTIGGHVLSSHTSAEVLGCTAIMLLDHVFDVI